MVADGLSFETAVVIVAANSFEGVPAEYTWLRNNYPGYKRNRQALMEHNGRAYDRVDIFTAQGEPLSIYFDVTSFYMNNF